MNMFRSLFRKKKKKLYVVTERETVDTGRHMYTYLLVNNKVEYMRDFLEKLTDILTLEDWAKIKIEIEYRK